VLFNQFIERPLAVAQSIGHVRMYLAGTVSGVELRHVLERFRGFRNGGVEYVHDLLRQLRQACWLCGLLYSFPCGGRWKGNLRNLLAGREGGNAGYRQEASFGSPRWCSTLPRGSLVPQCDYWIYP
jgi:hypothetical protein